MENIPEKIRTRKKLKKLKKMKMKIFNFLCEIAADSKF